MFAADPASRRTGFLLVPATVLVLVATHGDGAEPVVHRLRSDRQSGETLVKVLVPDRREQGSRFPVLYVLPVEPGEERHYGDGLEEVVRHDLHNKHRVICVLPTFSRLPWYADHPSDPGLRQESYLLHDVLPLVERSYPARTDREGRLLVGFSKSGWGAYSLLLRHPDVFGKAAAWDAPLTETAPQRFGMGPIFGTQANFENYRITSLLARRASDLGPRPRLVLLGYGNFREAHVAAHRQMTALNIPHVYRDGPQRKHDWHSGWLAEAVAALMAAP
ncbi:MAG: alpha/beta hydrolase-fold protein [Thermoguttaceae bacterium]|jgi:hypothetical protein|nr:alpha/beta hydrolase-fold protein [Thermoguttaceae bacterium]